ncbi:MAG: Na+/H+ antiporter NhaA [Myxococcales bacterium]|nr:Na+/H+ antiporter NhaA [Myxococcales bacterium]
MPIRKFIRLESAGGLVLMAAAVAALVLDNSPLAWLYDRLLSMPLAITLGEFGLKKPLLLWINDGLMAIFFLLVGLEIKREVLLGELSSRAKAALPLAAALGGLIAPAAVFVLLNYGQPENLKGWAIPAATDIAFALGILSLLGPRVPLSLKVLLTAIAIVDDLAAIVIIALFYTANLSWISIALAAACGIGLFVLNRKGVTGYIPYALVGIVMWVCVLKSGVHATLAGVALAMAIPLRTEGPVAASPLMRLEHALHPWVAFMIMPIFAFANAGVPLRGLQWQDLFQPLTLGIALGLFVGKQLGVFLAAWLAVMLRIADRPANAGWAQVYGVALLSGVGFTMSLFIGTLAFDGVDNVAAVRIGVISGSLLAGMSGYLVLLWTTKQSSTDSP